MSERRSADQPATAREIAQQPGLWRRIPGIVDEVSDALDEHVRPLVADPAARIVLTGAGTSAYAGDVLAPSLTRRLGRPVDAIATTDLVSAPEAHLVGDQPLLLVSFARSGDSPESVAAAHIANTRCPDTTHLVVTCNAEGRLARDDDLGRRVVVQLPPESNDEGFAMTSSFTSMTLAASAALAGDRDLEAVAAAGEQVLASVAERVAPLVASGPGRLIFLGSGALRGLAAESALKCLELTAGRLVAVAESALGFRHGPKALLSDATSVVVYLSNDPYTRRYDLDIAAELAAQLGGERVICIDGGAGADTEATLWPVPGVAGLDDALWGMAALIHAQTLALESSLALGLTPDNPFPGGEVNRVVKGVTIHPHDA